MDAGADIIRPRITGPLCPVKDRRLILYHVLPRRAPEFLIFNGNLKSSRRRSKTRGGKPERYSFLVKQITLFASVKSMDIWNRKLSVLSSSQSLANSRQPLSLAHASQAASSCLAYPFLR